MEYVFGLRSSEACGFLSLAAAMRSGSIGVHLSLKCNRPTSSPVLWCRMGSCTV